jgi:hypothetical protein
MGSALIIFIKPSHLQGGAIILFIKPSHVQGGAQAVQTDKTV